MFKSIRNAGKIFTSNYFLSNAVKAMFSIEYSIPQQNLKTFDPEVHKIIKLEEDRQKRSLALIASENFTTKAVLDALGTVLQNKYSEGT